MLTSFLSFYLATQIGQTQLLQGVPLKEEASVILTASSKIEEFASQGKAPIKKARYISPIINSKSAISLDLDSEAILYEKDSHKRRSIASITKLMTVMIILEENGLHEIATVSKNAASKEGSQIYLQAGEQITIENLLYAAIIHSANDAAIVLAEHNAGSLDSFVAKMNKKAQDLKLANTHFANPTGLDHPANYSTAYEVALLSKAVYKYPFIRHAARLQTYEISSTDGKTTHQLETTNNLLDSYLKINGLKTGRTERAGLCLTSIAENEEEKEIITVVLGSPDRFQESKILIDWTFRAHIW